MAASQPPRPSAPATVPPEASVPLEVLLVDGDAVSRRFAEQAFRDSGLNLEIALDGQQALDVLDRELFDVVVADNALSDMSGRQLLWRLRQQHRTARLPFLFWTGDNRPESRIEAYEVGAEILGKPCSAEELVARARSLGQRHREDCRGVMQRPYLLAGSFGALPISDLVSILSMSRRSGTLYLVTAGRGGTLVFREGALIRAELGNLSGPLAFIRAVTAVGGEFEFDGRGSAQEPDPALVGTSTNHLLLEAARRYDTAARDNAGGDIDTDDLVAGSGDLGPRDSARELVAALDTLGLSQATERLPDARPGPAFARAAAGALQNKMILGELRLLADSQLTAWSRDNTLSERALVLVVGDFERTISEMLAACTPPGEPMVLAALSAEAKYPAMTFVLRGGRAVEVLAVPQARVEGLELLMQRRPSVVLLTPRGGNALSAGTHSRVKLAIALSRLQPRLVAAVGDGSIPRFLIEARGLSRTPVSTHWIEAPAGVDGLPLRKAIAEALIAWGKLENKEVGSPWEQR